MHMQPRELVKLYYRIGEVAEIVGVQPHVLRYWETEFRTIRPQKSTKGQRVYSRRDVEKLLRVKDLLRNQGFTIAGARKKLHDPADEPRAERTLAPAERTLAPVERTLVPAERTLAPVERTLTPVERTLAAPERTSQSMRGALQAIRQDLLRMIAELDSRKTS
jgi:DNA-binding transcriptional MerR regulator